MEYHPNPPNSHKVIMNSKESLPLVPVHTQMTHSEIWTDFGG